jgi:hypothetical protein
LLLYAVVSRGGGLFEGRWGLPQELLLPLRHLMGMDFVPRGDLVDRFLRLDRFQSDLRLEVTREFPSRPFASLSCIHFQCAFYLSHWSDFWGALQFAISQSFCLQ